MGLELNHAIVRCTDKDVAAKFLVDLIGAAPARSSGPFAAVQVNAQLTLDFYDEDDFVFGHFAFLVDDIRFDVILQGATERDLPFGSGPFSRDKSINRLNNGRGVYVWDRDGNSYEFFTTDPLG